MTADDRVNALLETLGAQLDPAGLLIGDQVSGSYAEDAMGRGVRPPAVLRPRSSEEVAAILSAADTLRQPLVIQGGRTGLSGAARPEPGEISISLERMTGVLELDRQAQTITVLAGTPLQVVQEAALDAGLYFGVDIGARGSSAIGGNIATNAGGIRVLRYGMFRAQVAGLEVVLADGSILSSLKGLPKDNSGYDLNPLFIGTEGTLGVITKACLKLHPKPKGERNALLALPSLAAAQALLSRLRSEIGGLLSAFEIIFPDVYAETIDYMKLRPPVPVASASMPSSKSRVRLRKRTMRGSKLYSAQRSRMVLWRMRFFPARAANSTRSGASATGSTIISSRLAPWRITIWRCRLLASKNSSPRPKRPLPLSILRPGPSSSAILAMGTCITA